MKINFKSLSLGLLFMVFLLSCTQKTISPASALTVSEGFVNPIGFYDATPTFSWKLPISEEIIAQSAYHIVVASDSLLLNNTPDLWDSGKQQSSRSTFVSYQGKKLESRQKVYWKVKYWDQNELASEWSKTQHFEIGLLDNTDWQAKWIGLPTKEEKVLGSQENVVHRPQYLRKGFELSGEVVFARMYVTAKGVFDVAINGEDLSDDVMPPGWTPYQKRIETLTYDVTNLMESGQNTLAFTLAAGWHSGRLGWMKSFWNDTASPQLLCQLELTFKDGSKEIIISDASWKATTNGPIRLSEIYDGETYDAHLEMPNWTTNSFKDNHWKSVEVAPISKDVKLTPKRHATVKPKITLETKEVIVKDTTLIFDLAQNMVGVPLLKVPMRKGETLKIRFAEMLSPDGSFYTENYRSAQSTNYYTAAQDGPIEWQPKFTFHGFRYVELSGFDTSKTPSKDWVTGIVQYSDFDENGSFTTSHEKLNQLQSNIVWGLRGNFFDIPTDCPQRDERMGWTGDAQVFGPTSLFNADVHSFWASWLQSVRESQYENGGIPFVVPDVLNNDKVSSGWGDVAVIIPWKIYYRTGDTSILEENYEMMKKWVQHHQETSENYISSMNSFADWLQPYPENGNNKGDTSHPLIGTAFFAHSAKLTAQTAGVLGRPEEQATYEALYKKVAQAFEKEFFNLGEIKGVPATQTSYLLALAFDLLSDENRANAQQQLLVKIKEANNHLRTGFLGTPLLSQVLDEMAETDLMYQLLLNETYPSWFYSINQGATTIWERWNSYDKDEGFNPQRMNSLNHYAYGAVGEWMYERIAGIAPLEVGYKKIKIAPVMGGGLTSASGSYDSPYGMIKSAWTLENNTFNLEVTIPANTSALVELPPNYQKNILVNAIPEESPMNKIQLTAGTYTIQAKANEN